MEEDSKKVHEGEFAQSDSAQKAFVAPKLERHEKLPEITGFSKQPVFGDGGSF